MHGFAKESQHVRFSIIGVWAKVGRGIGGVKYLRKLNTFASDHDPNEPELFWFDFSLPQYSPPIRDAKCMVLQRKNQYSRLSIIAVGAKEGRGMRGVQYMDLPRETNTCASDYDPKSLYRSCILYTYISLYTYVTYIYICIVYIYIYHLRLSK